jgi:hypothetical protein
VELVEDVVQRGYEKYATPSNLPPCRIAACIRRGCRCRYMKRPPEHLPDGCRYRYMHAVKTLDLQEQLSAQGFMEVKMRSAGRYVS